MAISSVKLVEEKLGQSANKSKKALYAVSAGIAIIVVFFTAAALILKHAEVAKDIVELSTMAVMAFMALAMTLITGQAAFDWKAVSALQHMEIDETHREIIQSNQPINNVDISHGRSPKDFLRDSTF
jgi:cytochrome c biogenesis protein CcdA